jgi:hypothetical protein
MKIAFNFCGTSGGLQKRLMNGGIHSTVRISFTLKVRDYIFTLTPFFKE